MEYSKAIIQLGNLQIFPKIKPTQSFQKSIKNRKYILNLLKTFLKDSPYSDNPNIFYLSVLFHDLIVHNNIKNKKSLNNIDIICLCSFYLAVKSLETQIKMINIEQLKQVAGPKFESYTDNYILLCEIKCIKLLNYRINYITCYDCLYFYYSKNKKILHILNEELEKEVFNNEYLFYTKTQFQIANDIINNYKDKYNGKNCVNIKSVSINKDNIIYFKRERCYNKLNPKKGILLNNRISEEKKENINRNTGITAPNDTIYHRNASCCFQPKEANKSIINIYINPSNNIGHKTTTSSIDFSSIKQSKLNIDFKNLSTLSSNINTKVFKKFSQVTVNLFKQKIN